MRLQPYWLESAPAFQGGAEGAVDSLVDVAVIGGGFTGLSAGLALVRRGAKVAVLEAGRVLGEASGRNGGHCNNGTFQDHASLQAAVGPERANNYYQAFTAAVNTVERLVRSENIECDFRRCGRLKLAAKPEHFEKFVQTHKVLQASVDSDVHLISPDSIRFEVGSDAFHGGLLQATSAQMHVGKFGIGLATALVKSGGRVFEKAAVRDITRLSNGNFKVDSSRGVIEARQVLLATGSTKRGRPLGWFRRRLVSVGSIVIVTEPLDEEHLKQLLPARRNYVTSKNIGNYFRTTADHRLVFGGRARFAMSNPNFDEKSGLVLQRALTEIFPTLRRTKIDYCWGGMVDMTQDRLPRAGEHEGMHYSLGYSGHGVQMSVHMGQMMAEVMDGHPESNPWRDLPWPAIPGYFGKPWFLPLVGAYYRLKDVFN